MVVVFYISFETFLLGRINFEHCSHFNFFEVHPSLGKKAASAPISPYLYILSYIIIYIIQYYPLSGIRDIIYSSSTPISLLLLLQAPVYV